MLFPKISASSICVAWNEIAQTIFLLLPSLSLSPQNQVSAEGTPAAAMANVIMASSKTLIPPPSTTTTTSKPKQPIFSLPKLHLPKIPPNPITRQSILSLSSAALKSSAAVAASLLAAAPALAEQMEKAALFDFNLTLPIIMVEFLLLMVVLDKIYYTPLGKFMDDRDAAIKEELSSVKDTSEEVKQLEEQAAAVMRAARAEISAALTKMKAETQVELDEKLAEGRRKVEAELKEAVASLEKQKEEAIKALDSQIAALSDDVVKKVLPM
ncbi:ATP synthase subunit b', chloroplastic [Malania oleifera]|uniref:ATP synthase subunit b', chloroplastic n=1 Tax=Malania oleifera TaxID=397392 RepID=UPI0025AEB542|nr:ATP synthase subunit b', chloroplastic [Malania oleifera]